MACGLGKFPRTKAGDDGQNNEPSKMPTRQRRQIDRIIRTEIRDGRVWQLHATKGWRSRRAA